MRRPALPPLLLLPLLLGCPDSGDPPTPDVPRAPAAAAADSLPPLPEGVDLVLAPAAEGEWRVRPLGYAPPYFLARGWADVRTLWGLSGTTTFLVRADEPEYSVWTRGSWDAALAPDGDVLAWIDGRGAWVGDRSGEPRLLLERDAAIGVEGDLGGPLLWSPGGDRLLLRWTGEAGPTFGVVRVPGGETALLPRRGDGFLLVEAFAWLDAERILFTALPRLPTDGGEVEWAGLAVVDASGGAPALLAGGPSAGSVLPLAPWGEDVLVAADRVLVLDPEDGSTRPTTLPLGDRIVARDTTAAVVVEDLGEEAGGREYALHLWSAATGAATPLARVRGSDLRIEWSPTGERLVLSRVVREEARTVLLERVRPRR